MHTSYMGHALGTNVRALLGLVTQGIQGLEVLSDEYFKYLISLKIASRNELRSYQMVTIVPIFGQFAKPCLPQVGRCPHHLGAFQPFEKAHCQGRIHIRRVPDLARKVKNALDENRILILGVQVLLGFQFRAFMEPGFDKLPKNTQAIQFVGLILLLAAVAVVLVPSARHRIVEGGQDSTALQRFAMTAASAALVPFAAAIGVDFYFASERLAGAAAGLASGIAACLLVLGLWFVLPLTMRLPANQEEEIVENPRLPDRIVQVLTECRVVLPGAQALLGFQLAMLLMESFEKLKPLAQELHLVSLCFLAATTAMLMAPAAWHRLAERGRDTERLEKFASGMVLGALAALAVGLSLELAVVVSKWSGSVAAALTYGVICLVLLLALWFGLTLGLRVYFKRRENRAQGLSIHESKA